MNRQIPSSVYRLQLSTDFNLKQAQNLLPYLVDLGIEGIYCSPVFHSISQHGYDVINPNRLDPSLGSEQEWKTFCQKAHESGMSILLDVVPNHMGIKKGNLWWQDVLEQGPYSQYASYFDINWVPEKPELLNKVLLPILNAPFGEIIENQEIVLNYREGKFFFTYGDYELPLSPASYTSILEKIEKDIQDSAVVARLQKLKETFSKLLPEVQNKKDTLKKHAHQYLQDIVEQVSEVKKALHVTLSFYQGKKRIPLSLNPLEALLNEQFYRLAYWKVAAHEINYRRFFNLNELVCLSMESPGVLEAHHAWVFKQLAEGNIHGLRIDHPDGLYDPVAYFESLRKHGCQWTVVEKILDLDEELPQDWEVEGTVGYEFLNLLNGLFVYKPHGIRFETIYQRFIGETFDFPTISYKAKEEFVRYQMASEVEGLGLMLARLVERNRYYRDFTRLDLTKALGILICCFPVYRTYLRLQGRVSRRDSYWIKKAFEKARQKGSFLDASLWDFLEKLFLGKAKLTLDEQPLYRHFLLKFQQVTGAIMAKGVEDTSFYRYNRLISLNEVGGNPLQFGQSLTAFHRFNQRKKEKWPYGLISSSTHDSKSSEDVRMRLNVLSEMPEEWEKEVKRWATLNNRWKIEQMPSLNTEYYLYQTLLAAWPHPLLKKEEHQHFIERIWTSILKSLREAGQQTSWRSPNGAYEGATKAFLEAILNNQPGNTFLSLFLDFQKKLHFYGQWNSLSQLCLKIGCCGVVDIYQGNETWSYQLVDPDNRGPVDFGSRRTLLGAHMQLRSPSFDLESLKLYVAWKGLGFRKEHKELFLKGEYLPLTVEGIKKIHVVAFARVLENRVVLITAGRFFHKLTNQLKAPSGRLWEKTKIILPEEFKKREWKDIFTHEEQNGSELSLEKVFQKLPFSILYSDSKRS